MLHFRPLGRDVGCTPNSLNRKYAVYAYGFKVSIASIPAFWWLPIYLAPISMRQIVWITNTPVINQAFQPCWFGKVGLTSHCRRCWPNVKITSRISKSKPLVRSLLRLDWSVDWLRWLIFSNCDSSVIHVFWSCLSGRVPVKYLQ